MTLSSAAGIVGGVERQRLGRLVQLAIERLHVVAAGERRPPRDHLVEEAGERVDVAARVDVAPRDLLGRHVERRADDLAGARQLLGAGDGGDFRQPEVDQLRRLAHLAIGSEDDVGRLEIAMDDAGGVRRVEPPGQARRDVHRALDRHRLLAREHRRQRLARHVLHDEERRIADDDVEEAGHVGMLDGAHRLRLVLEALAELGVGEQLGLEHLDGDDRADGAVLGGEDVAHGAAAEHLEQAVAIADDVAGRERAPRQDVGEAVGQRVDAREAAVGELALHLFGRHRARRGSGVAISADGTFCRSVSMRAMSSSPLVASASLASSSAEARTVSASPPSNSGRSFGESSLLRPMRAQFPVGDLT